MPSDGRFWITLALALAVVAGGLFIGLPSADSPPAAEDVFEGAFVHAEDLEGVAGVQVTTLERDGEVVRHERLAVRERPYTDYRHEILDSSDPDRIDEVYVSNAAGSWWYHPDEGTVTAYEPAEPFDDDAVRESRAEQADRQQRLYDLDYRGTETVADREAHRLAVTARNESTTAGISLLVGDVEFVYAAATIDPTAELHVVEQTVWIDAEHDYPLAERLVVEDPDGDRYVLAERFESARFDPGFETGAFDFDPPANATVERVTED